MRNAEWYITIRLVRVCMGSREIRSELADPSRVSMLACKMCFHCFPPLACPTKKCMFYFIYLVQAEEEVKPPVRPCSPSPCGPYSICREQNDHAVCSCSPEHVGAPPNCRPECVISTECPQDKSCINQRCTDPCPGTCGHLARCRTVNHNPICSCPPGHVGDPFVRCVKEESKRSAL